MSSHRIEGDAQSHMALFLSVPVMWSFGRPICMLVEKQKSKAAKQSVQMNDISVQAKLQRG